MNEEQPEAIEPPPLSTVMVARNPDGSWRCMWTGGMYEAAELARLGADFIHAQLLAGSAIRQKPEETVD